MTVTEKALACSDTAAHRLAPYEAKIAGNFEIPLHIGKLIAAWDRPKFVTVTDATHMRDDDYVVGVEYKGQFRAYPLWITDNYHIINDRIAGDPILFSTCERCQSGSAFVSELGGQAVRFSAMGMYNASLTMVNRKRSKSDCHSIWLHYEGVAIDGPEKGRFLKQVPTYHTTWKTWAAAHPQTDVMLAPDDPHHRDARHGHGREEYFSRPGMDPPLAKTITGRFDHRYPENEMVLGINIDAGIRAYPLLEVNREGGAVNDELGEVSLAVFCGPRPEEITMAAFSRTVDDQVLTFERSDGRFRDRETSSLWTIEGRAISGSLEGRRLQPLRWQYVRWHAWVYPHPSTDLFLSTRPRPRYPDFLQRPEVESLTKILANLADGNEELTFSHTLAELMLPQEATGGICVYSGTDRLNLYTFTSPAAAADYVALEGAWFCMPFDAKIARKRAVRMGSCVVESDPMNVYAEPTQTVRYPDNEITWSASLQRPGVTAALIMPPISGGGIEGHFMPLVRYLRQKRYDVIEVAFLPRRQLRVGTISAVAAIIEADRFAIYRCVDEAAAAAVADEVTHAICEGSWVLRSIPVLMYADPHYEMGQLPDDKIAWSPLLSNDRFRSDLKAFAHQS
jgi:hypothetical protein